MMGDVAELFDAACARYPFMHRIVMKMDRKGIFEI